MNVDKEGNVRQGSNNQETKKEAPKKETKKETKKEKAKKVARKLKVAFKKAGKKVLKRLPLVGNLTAKKAGASSLEDLSVAQLKKMGMSDAQIKKIKGQ